MLPMISKYYGRLSWRKTSKLHVTGLLRWESIGGFPLKGPVIQKTFPYHDVMIYLYDVCKSMFSHVPTYPWGTVPLRWLFLGLSRLELHYLQTAAVNNPGDHSLTSILGGRQCHNCLVSFPMGVCGQVVYKYRNMLIISYLCILLRC